MKIHSVYAENFMLFRKFKKVFYDKEIIGIVAEHKSNSLRSNKGGKSTVPEMILWCLTGESRAKRDIELIHHGAEVMKVRTTLVDDDGTKIRITRGRDIKGHGILEVSGIDRKVDAQAYIDDLIGYNKKELPLTCFLKQMEIEGFMALGPAAMKQHMMNWLKNTHWNTLENNAKEDLSVKQKKLEKIETQLELLRSQLKDSNKTQMRADLDQLECEFKDETKKVSKLEKRLATIKLKRKTFDADVETVETKIDELKVDIEDLEEGQDDDVKITKKLKKYAKHKDIDTEKVSDQRAAAKAKHSKLEELVESMESDFTGACPILGESCDRIKYDKKSVKKTKGIISVLQEKLDIFADQLTGQGEWADAEASRKATKKVKAKLDPLRRRLTDLKQELKDLIKGAEDYPCTSDLRSKLKKAQEQQSTTSQAVGRANADIDRSKKTRLQIKDLGSKINKLTRGIGDLRYITNMFGKNGIPSLEIENAFDEVEDEMNLILDRWENGLQLEFKPTRETGAWEDYCISCGWQFPKGTRTKTCEECNADRQRKRKDELHLTVIEGDNETDFRMESGGGKTMVALSVRIGMTRLKQRETGSRFRVLFLDEPDASLDPVNKAAFVKLITETLIKDFGFQQVFWISHDRNIQESIPHVLKMTRYKTHSKATWL